MRLILTDLERSESRFGSVDSDCRDDKTIESKYKKKHLKSEKLKTNDTS